MSNARTAIEDCPQCSSLMGKYGCLSCGWVRSTVSVIPFKYDTDGHIEVDGVNYTVQRVHESNDHVTRFIAADPAGDIVEIMVSSSNELIQQRVGQCKKYPNYFAALIATEAFDEGWIAVFELGSAGRSLVSELAMARSNRATNRCTDLCDSVVRPILTILAEIHTANLCLSCHNPAEIWISENGEMRLLNCPLIAQTQPPTENQVNPSFSPPEAYGRCGGLLSQRADVFFVGMILYQCLTRVPVPSAVGLVHDRLPPPSLFHPRIPPELESVAKKATSVVPSFRYADSMELSAAVSWAVELDRLRTTPGRAPKHLDYASETHIGLLKQRYCAENQDSHFSAWDASDSRGLFIVSDGVSVSEFGTGDQASRIVTDAAEALWQSLSNEALFSADETLGAFDSTIDVSADLSLSPLPSGSGARNRLLLDMLDAANATIGTTIHDELPSSMIHPEGIMAATAVCCLIENARMTYCSIGDSRIYLVRDGHICTLNVEHNYASRLIAMGKDYNTSTSVPNAAALVQCVGEFEFDAHHRLRPVPLKPDFGELQLLPGDTIVLCSDGIPDYLTSSEEQSERLILEFVEAAVSTSHLAYDLVVAANRGGGGDNLTCTVITVS